MNKKGWTWGRLASLIIALVVLGIILVMIYFLKDTLYEKTAMIKDIFKFS